MHMPTNQGPDVPVQQIRPLSDDVQVNPFVPVRFQRLDVRRDATTRRARSPHALHLIDNDDRAIRHRVVPLMRIAQRRHVHARQLQIGNAVGIDGPPLADSCQQIDKRGRFARSWRAGDERDHQRFPVAAIMPNLVSCDQDRAATMPPDTMDTA